MKRVDEGSCPIHGIGLTPTSGWHNADGTPACHHGPFPQYILVECPRNDCDIKAKATSPDGPVELLPEFQHLLASTEAVS